jgi:NTP pyrophosphatase (non-canonical NTP hydrolase)
VNLDQYQQEVLSLSVYEDVGNNLIYPALGLGGESGEVQEKCKKLWRNMGIKGGASVPSENIRELSKELGDVTFYVAALCNEIGISFQDVIDQNIEKLLDRRERGVIKSEGDNR